MDRELVLFLLAVVAAGGDAQAVGWWPPVTDMSSNGRVLERIAWRRLWTPLLPAALLLAALGGWAVVEPEQSESVPVAFMASAVPFVALLLRAVRRALRALDLSKIEVVAATVGLVRPRVIVSSRLADLLEDDALKAVREHEQAHAWHRDPLRMWIAQLATDLQWPWTGSARRFDAWRETLELARDEEARCQGVEGPDLAAGVLAAARLGGDRGRVAVASAADAPASLRVRVLRLLQPLAPEERLPASRLLWVVMLLATAAALGAAFGERLIPAVFALV